MTQAMMGRPGEGQNMLGTRILNHSMEGKHMDHSTSINGISNSTRNNGSQCTCARTESSMAEQLLEESNGA